jgi:hypothetical protein
MQSDKKIFAGLLLLTFIGIVYVAVQFMQEGVGLQPEFNENFMNPKKKFLLAAQCQCLPGYIPSRNAGCSAGKSGPAGPQYFCKRICDSIDPNCDPVNDVRPCY